MLVDAFDQVHLDESSPGLDYELLHKRTAESLRDDAGHLTDHPEKRERRGKAEDAENRGHDIARHGRVASRSQPVVGATALTHTGPTATSSTRLIEFPLRPLRSSFSV
jgi:hypothetical protein